MASVLDNALSNSFGSLFKSGVALADSVQMRVNNKIYDGWSTVSISKSMFSITPSFTLTVADRWRQTKEKFPIMPGNQIKIGIGPADEPVISGYLETFAASVSNEERTISVSGRSKTGDLVDSAAIGLTSTYKNITLEALANIYTAPFGIGTKDETSDKATLIKKVTVQQGETIFELLSRYAKERGVLLVGTNDGNLLISNRDAKKSIVNASTGAAVLSQSIKSALGKTQGLIQGKNVLFAESNFDETDRYFTYLAKSQIPGDEDFVSPTQSAFSEGTAFDNAVSRPRTKYFVIEKSADNTYAKKRAIWECNQSAAKAATANVTVQGWRNSEGKLWDVNTLVDTDLRFIGFTKGYYLITDVTFVQTKDQGTLTTLTLTRSDGYSVSEPALPNDPKRDSGWDSKIFGNSLKELADAIGFNKK